MAFGVTQMSALVTVTLTMTMMWGEATAQSGCTSALMGLTPCLGFIQGGLSNPSSSCCSGLASVVKSQAACLCQVLNGGGSSFGVTINQTQALALPGACKVQTPPVSECNAVNKPSEAPAGSPVGSPTGAPADALAPEGDDQSNTSTFSSSPSAGVGSKSTKTGSTSDGNMIKSSIHFTLLLFITSVASAIIRF